MKNLSLIVAAFFGLVLFVSAQTQTQKEACEYRPEGWVEEIGCWGYYQCVNGTLEKFPCPAGTVLQRDGLTCVEPGTGTTSCGKAAICRGKDNGYYADIASGCESYFYCLSELNMGRQYCPADLVWNDAFLYCDRKYNVAPPCGTREG